MALTKCTVSGTLKDTADNGIAGSVVITPSAFGLTLADNDQVTFEEVTAECADNGDWSAILVQSAMFETPVTYEFEFRDADGNFLFRESGKTIPAEATKQYNALS